MLPLELYDLPLGRIGTAVFAEEICQRNCARADLARTMFFRVAKATIEIGEAPQTDSKCCQEEKESNDGWNKAC